MLLDDIQAAMNKAKYEILPDDHTYFGRIPGFKGVWANAETLENCRRELQSTLEDWLLLGIALGHKLPTINEIRPRNPRTPRKITGTVAIATQ